MVSGKYTRYATYVFVVMMIVTAFFQIVDLDDASGSEIQWKPSNDDDGTLLNITNIPIQAGTNNGPRRTVIEENGKLYVLSSWTNGTIATLTLLISNNEGQDWNVTMDVWYDNISYDVLSIPIMGLYIWKETLFVFFRIAGEKRSEAIMYCKNAKLDSLSDLPDQTPYEIIDFEANMFDMTSNDDYLFLAYSRQGELECYFTKYDGTSWSAPYKIASRGNAVNVDIEIIDDDGTETLLYFFAHYNFPPNDDGNIYMRRSTDYGFSWSSATVVMDGEEQYHIINVEKVNDKLYLFGGEKIQDDLDMSISTDGGDTWSDEKSLLENRGRNPVRANLTDTGLTDYSVGVSDDGMNMTIVYESSSEYIHMITSQDGGSTWTDEEKSIIISKKGSYNPSLSPDGKFVTYYTQTDQWKIGYQLLWKVEDLEPEVKTFGPVILTNDVKTAKVNVTYTNTYAALDQDTKQSDLVWSLMTNATWLSFTNRSTLSGTPTMSGSFWVNITVSDGKLMDFTNFTLKVYPVKKNTGNETEYPEYYDDPLSISLPEEEEDYTVDIEAVFELIEGFELIDIIGSSNVKVTNTEGYIYLIEPSLNWAGSETITLLFEKDGVSIERNLEVTVENRNDPPTPPSILIPEELIEGIEYEFQASSDDPDLPYGDMIDYKWYINGDRYLGRGDSIFSDLPAGEHTLKVVVEDSYGATNERTVKINVSAKPLEMKEDEDPQTFQILLLVMMIMTIIIIISSLLLIFRKRSMRTNEQVQGSVPDHPQYSSIPSSNHFKGSPSMSVTSGLKAGHINEFNYQRQPSIEYSRIKSEMLQGRGKWMDVKNIEKSIEKMRDEGRISIETYNIILERIRDD